MSVFATNVTPVSACSFSQIISPNDNDRVREFREVVWFDESTMPVGMNMISENHPLSATPSIKMAYTGSTAYFALVDEGEHPLPMAVRNQVLARYVDRNRFPSKMQELLKVGKIEDAQTDNEPMPMVLNLDQGYRGFELRTLTGDLQGINPKLPRMRVKSERIPSDVQFSILVALNEMLFEISGTVSFMENPVFGQDKHYPRLTARQIVEGSSFAVKGYPISVDENGRVRFKVSRWVRGNGSDEISIAGFGDGCFMTPIPLRDETVYVLDKSIVESGQYRLLRDPWRNSFIVSPQTLIGLNAPAWVAYALTFLILVILPLSLIMFALWFVKNYRLEVMFIRRRRG